MDVRPVASVDGAWNGKVDEVSLTRHGFSRGQTGLEGVVLPVDCRAIFIRGELSYRCDCLEGGDQRNPSNKSHRGSHVHPPVLYLEATPCCDHSILPEWDVTSSESCEFGNPLSTLHATVGHWRTRQTILLGEWSQLPIRPDARTDLSTRLSPDPTADVLNNRMVSLVTRCTVKTFHVCSIFIGV